MTKLIWDQVGERFYESGIDQGVLYLSDGSAIPWNGLTSVQEDFSEDTTTPYYLDGVKYMDVQSTGDFTATLTALTYPDKLDEYAGIVDVTDAVLTDGQPTKTFCLSYRTLIGNDLQGNDLGYKIHVIYDITVINDVPVYTSLNKNATAPEFSWKIKGLPQDVPGYRPTAHIIIDSRYTNSYFLASLETMLYGDDTTEAMLPTLDDLVSYVSNWDLIEIRDNLDGTWTVTGPDEYVFLLDDTTFQINNVNVIWIDAVTYKITTTQFVEDGGTNA